MLIDITLKITPKMVFDAQGNEKKALFGHLGTHFDVMNDLIEALVEKGVSIIGIDFAGVRRGQEHTPMDQFCAERGLFIVENLCNLSDLLKHGIYFQAYTCPMNFAEMTGLPCRVVAKL